MRIIEPVFRWLMAFNFWKINFGIWYKLEFDIVNHFTGVILVLTSLYIHNGICSNCMRYQNCVIKENLKVRTSIEFTQFCVLYSRILCGSWWTFWKADQRRHFDHWVRPEGICKDRSSYLQSAGIITINTLYRKNFCNRKFYWLCYTLG